MPFACTFCINSHDEPLARMLIEGQYAAAFLNNMWMERNITGILLKPERVVMLKTMMSGR